MLCLTEPFPPAVRRHPEQIDGSFYIRQDWDEKGWSVMYEDETLADALPSAADGIRNRTNISAIRPR